MIKLQETEYPIGIRIISEKDWTTIIESDNHAEVLDKLIALLNDDKIDVDGQFFRVIGDTKDDTKEDGNKHIDILHHDISYYFRDTELDIDDCGVEHIEYYIGQGFSEGDFNRRDPDDSEMVYYGYWKIVK